MIDIHTHILYGIDDGSPSIEESLAIMKKLEKLGFSKVVATPHYIEGSSYRADNEKKIDLSTELYVRSKEENIGVSLYLGNEVYIFDEIKLYLQKNEIYRINDTRYLLIELPFHSLLPNLDVFIEDLIESGIVPIIAHPERYVYYQKEPKQVLELLKKGALFQSNFGSIIGKYGKAAEETLTFFLENDCIQFLATDVHRKDSDFFERFDEMQNKIISIVGKEKYKELTHENPSSVLKDKDIYVPIPTFQEKKSLFSKLFHT